MDTLEMNNYLVDENDKLKIQIRKWKTKCRKMEQLNREMFQILQESEKDLKGLEYIHGVILGKDNEQLEN